MESEQRVAVNRDESSPDEMVVELRAPTPTIHVEMLQILGHRQHETLSKHFVPKYGELQPDVMEAMIQTAYLMEYCRHSRMRAMVVKDSWGEEPPVRLELEELVLHPKLCERNGCNRIGVISCSKCLITVWCSEECLSESISGNHVEVCAAGCQVRKQLSV